MQICTDSLHKIAYVQGMMNICSWLDEHMFVTQ